jgi:hypothetical protein
MSTNLVKLNLIVMRKLKTLADMLAIVDVCIEASEARARLLESQGKGISRKKDDREVNTVDRGERMDRGDRGFHANQSSEQKEKRSFQRPDEAGHAMRFTVPRVTIWRSAKLSYIRRRCHPQ